MFHFTNSNHHTADTSCYPPEFLRVGKAYISAYGEVVKGRTGKLKECFNVNLTLWGNDLEHLRNYIRMQRNDEFLEYSSLLISGQAIPAFNAPGHPGYGDSIRARHRLIDILKADPTSRRAVAVISDETCFTSYQILIRDNKLQLLLNARSVHLIQGLPLDVLFWAEQIFWPVAKALGISPGGMHINIGSLHL